MNYEVGKFYKVRCLELLNQNGELIEAVPVIGRWHKDPQFGSNHEHMHVDGRFLGSSVFIPHIGGKTNYVVWKNLSTDHPNVRYKIGQEVYRRLKCKRDSTGLIWYSSFVGKSCKGKKCPHLGQEMIDQGGVLVCPLHNLKGCPIEEIIIPF